MTDPRPDPVTEARDALATALASVHREADPEGRDFALADLILAALPAGWTLVREAGGVSVEVVRSELGKHRIHIDWGYQRVSCSCDWRDDFNPMADIVTFTEHLVGAVPSILTARSAGSGSRVERECVCGHGWADHGLTGGCEAEWGTGDGDVFCPCTTPTPDPTSPCSVCGQNGYRTVHAMPGSRRHPHQPTRCLTCHHPIEAINPGPAASGSEGGTDHG